MQWPYGYVQRLLSSRHVFGLLNLADGDANGSRLELQQGPELRLRLKPLAAILAEQSRTAHAPLCLYLVSHIPSHHSPAQAATTH